MLLKLLLFVPSVLLALTVHEYAHGWAADRLGDPTARYAGRLTLNPLAHLDPLGTVMLFLVHVGWAKPVPINPYNLHDPRRDMIWVSVAGPGANMFTALAFGILLRPFQLEGGDFSGLTGLIKLVFVYCVVINLILAAFNLIPIPPLDGSRILMGILPPYPASLYHHLERLGPFLIMGIILVGYALHVPTFWGVIKPFVRLFSSLFSGYDLSQLF